MGLQKGSKLKKFRISRATVENVIIFDIMAALLTVVFLSFFPGILTSDSNDQWNQIAAHNITNSHPFFSTYFWSVLAKIVPGRMSLPIFQMFLLSLNWTFTCYSLRTENNFLRRIVYTVIVCFIPIIFAYSVTAWKDIIYSYVLMFTGTMIYVGIKKKFQYNYFEIFTLSLSMVFAALYRYNGIIAVVLLAFAFLVIFKKHKVSAKKIIAFFAMLIILFGVCKIPEKVLLKTDSNTGTGYVKMFILASFVKEDKIDDKNDLETINKIYPIKDLKKNYSPYLINTLQLPRICNDKALDEHSGDVTKMLIKYSLKHPSVIIKHYFKADNVLIGVSYQKGYIFHYPFSEWITDINGRFDAITSPVFEKGYEFYLGLINYSLHSDLLRLFYLPGWILYISLAIMLFYSRRKKDNRYLLVLLPMIFNTISLAPINLAQDLRYAYINYLTLILIVLPIVLFDKACKKNKASAIPEESIKPLILIPAYNEAENIEKTVNDVIRNTSYDYLVVNDCSKDDTEKVCIKNGFNYISLPVNFGLTSVVQLGMKYANRYGYNIVLQFDGDGQHQAKYINPLIKEISSGNCDIAVGSRFVSVKKPHTLRMLGSNIISFCIKIATGKTVKDPTSGMRAYNEKAINKFILDKSLTPEPDTLVYMHKKGLKVKEVQVEMSEREFGESYLKPLKAIEYMFNMTCSILFIRSFTESDTKEN